LEAKGVKGDPGRCMWARGDRVPPTKCPVRLSPPHHPHHLSTLEGEAGSHTEDSPPVEVRLATQAPGTLGPTRVAFCKKVTTPRSSCRRAAAPEKFVRTASMSIILELWESESPTVSRKTGALEARTSTKANCHSSTENQRQALRCPSKRIPLNIH